LRFERGLAEVKELLWYGENVCWVGNMCPVTRSDGPFVGLGEAYPQDVGLRVLMRGPGADRLEADRCVMLEVAGLVTKSIG
jgi:hypothetical protein